MKKPRCLIVSMVLKLSLLALFDEVAQNYVTVNLYLNTVSRTC